MTVTHPVALRDGRAHPGGYTYGSVTYPVDDGGVIDCPEDVEDEIAETLAERYDTDVDALLEGEADSDDASTCDTVKSDGEVCGRELPCPYHSED